ncbi:uncharacterized protein ColSpa_10985 [Colletotrichum spaethianum]|uniref:Uncharacterized protein n=1 Tax=Colletotrichum spaethianum TaxID=700344 RepID=A0AA37UK40_9PEZI|nr:uncharacterized protein ColSpa_10985 [Colletotrichum spaethianum]GKT50804.1 hypothetical protein ColSpa_10985 [Colletotrichum spaethianum]
MSSGLLEDLRDGGGEYPATIRNDEDLKELSRWLLDARLLCDPDDEFGQLVPSFQYDYMNEPFVFGTEEVPEADVVRKHRTKSQASDIEIHFPETVEGPKFIRIDPDGSKFRVEMDYNNSTDSDDRVHAVVHSVCLELAGKVFESSRVAHVRDMRGLFLALRWRQGICYKSGGLWDCQPQVNYMLANHGYYVPQCDCIYDGMDWSGPYTSPRANLFHPCRSQVALTAEADKLAKNLARMPTEIMETIFEYMGRDLPRLSSRLVSQKIWKEHLKAACRGVGLLPWLWDINTALVDAKDAELCPGGPGFEWDWELLARQLSRGVDYGVRPDCPKDVYPYPAWFDSPLTWHMVCTGSHTDLAHVPAGLHNRRRIWQLLEEMFVGDAIPWPARQHCWWRRKNHVREKCMPLWWDKSGNVLPSPIWIPSIYLTWYADPESHPEAIFLRRLGGEVYAFKGKSRLQYWQEDAKENSDCALTVDEAGEVKPRPATVEEIYAVLRPLGYPV